MTSPDSMAVPQTPSAPGRRRTVVIAGAVAVAVLVGGAATALALSQGGSASAASCNGPAGAAYVSDTGWDGFSAIDTATCTVEQTYNVGDPDVKGFPDDQSYDSTNEGVLLHNGQLWSADAGNSTVAVINTRKLDASNYNPAEKLINVGLNPEALAISPDGKQLWVADTGPQTSASSPSQVTVISTATRAVTATIKVPGGPSAIVFAPSGADAYVVTKSGLRVYDTTTRKQVAKVGGLGDPRAAAMSADGKTVYVTDTRAGTLVAISTASNKVEWSAKVGQMPWEVILAHTGKTAYVSNPDSDTISLVSTSTGKVTRTVSVTGGPEALALTPNGKQLWVGQSTAATVTVLSNTDFSAVGTINLGGDEAQSGDGYDPTVMVLTSSPTAGS